MGDELRLSIKWKYLTATAGKKHNVNQSSQTMSLTLRYAKNAKSTPEVIPLIYYSSSSSSSSGGGRGGRWPMEELRHSSSSVYSSSRLARGGAHTLARRAQHHSHCGYLETYSQEDPNSSSTADTLHKKM